MCNVASCWLYLEIHLRCTDPRTSNHQLIPHTIFNMIATFRLTTVRFCVYLDVSDECPIIQERTNFPKSGATSKIYTQNGWAEASSIRKPTDIKRYYTGYARIHQTQSNEVYNNKHAHSFPHHSSFSKL